MKILQACLCVVLLFAPNALAQEPVPISNARWERATRPAPQREVSPTVPSKPVLPENKHFQRKAREQRTDNPMDPYEASIEGRSAAMEKAVQQSRAAQPDHTNGYMYSAQLRNDTGKTIEVIFWEFQFTENARPENVIRRQFLCGMKMKNGDSRSVTAFSTFGPSDVIDAESLGKSSGKMFNEKVQVNRIEFADGTILQRNGWKYSDVKADVERATATPWGNDTCRAL